MLYLTDEFSFDGEWQEETAEQDARDRESLERHDRLGELGPEEEE